MPDTTDCRSYPFPLDGDDIDVAGDVERLAVAVDTDVCAVVAQVDALGVDLGEMHTDLNTHLSAPVAHTAADIAFVPTGTIQSTNVQDAILEAAVEGGGGGGGGSIISVNGDAGPAVNLIASEIPADTSSGFPGTNVQAQLGQARAASANNTNNLAAHMGQVTDAHDASAVSFVPTGTIAATNVQAAIAEVAAEMGGGGGGGTVTSVNGDVGPAVSLIASEIPFTPSGTISATTVQAAILEVAAEAGGPGGGGTITSVNGDAGPSVSLFASEIPFTPTGTIGSSNTQAAVAEVAGDAQAALSIHDADTTNIHGIANTANLVLTNDPRLTDSRTPTAHAVSHQDGGADELTLDGSQITTGLVADARIAATIARDTEVTAAVAAHTGLAVGAHAASAIAFTPTGTIAATTVQTAIAEVATEATAALAAHTGLATGAHAATAISFAPTGTIAATTVQAAIAEVAAEAAAGGTGLPDGDFAGQLLATWDGTGANVAWVNPPDEVYVGAAGPPTDPWYELWYDTDDPGDPGSLAGGTDTVWNTLTLLNGYTGIAKWKKYGNIGYVFGTLSNGAGIAFTLPAVIRPLIFRNALITGGPGPGLRMMSINQTTGDATFDTALTAHSWGFQFMYEVA